MNRDENITIRLNEAELDFIKNKAESVGMTISNYVRNEIIKIKISTEAEAERSKPETVLSIQEELELEIKTSFIKTSDSKRIRKCNTRTQAAKGFKRAGKSGLKIR